MKKVLIHIISPLFIGGLIYLLFRSEDLLMFEWYRKIGLSDFLIYLRSNTITLKQNIPEWVIFSLPNCLWLYSILSFLNIIWKDDNKVKIVLMILTSLSIIFIEILQAVGLIIGTFCWQDIISIFLLIFIFILIHQNSITFKQKSYEEYT